MRQCLTSDLGGYYTNQPGQDADQFGTKGDFVTSPEISQIFGELVGIWFVTEWMAQGKKSSGVQLIELGPGRGTLMGDALRTVKNFKTMASAVDTIYLVESSPALREAQKKRLCDEKAPMKEQPLGFESQSKHLPGAKVVWVEDIKFIPREQDKTPFIIAHEFYDALPIHAFQALRKPNRTIERQSRNTSSLKSNTIPNITTDAVGEVSPAATVVLSGTAITIPKPAPTQSAFSPLAMETASDELTSKNSVKYSGTDSNFWRELVVSPTAPPSVINPPKEPGPEFELTVHPGPTRYSKVLPKLSQRYEKILPIIGATVEICPEARTTTAALVELITGSLPPLPFPPSQTSNPNTSTSATTTTPTKSVPSGAALIIDYGPSDTVPISTLRGIKNHKRVSPFSSPGIVDISADVDFGAIVEAALEASPGIEVHGPAEQGDWLAALGGRERSEMLVTKAPTNEVRDRLKTGWSRLVDKGPNGMGKVYKVLALVPNSEGKRRPVGFGGDVV